MTRYAVRHKTRFGKQQLWTLHKTAIDAHRKVNGTEHCGPLPADAVVYPR